MAVILACILSATYGSIGTIALVNYLDKRDNEKRRIAFEAAEQRRLEAEQNLIPIPDIQTA